MRKLNSMSLGATQGVVARLQKPLDVKPHTRALALIFDAQITVANTSGGAITLTNAQAVDLMTKFFGTINMLFGKVAQETVDDSRSFTDMRKLGIALTGRDQRFNGKELRNYAHTDSDAVVIADTESEVVRCAYIRYFYFERAGTRLDEWAPFASQLRSMSMSITRGAALSTAGLAQSGNADITVYIDEVDAEAEDGWAPVPRLYVSNDAGLIHEGPQGGGVLFDLYEDTAVGASTSLELISLERAGDTALHDTVEAPEIVRDSYIRRPQNSVNLNDYATELFALPESIGFDRLPTASAFRLKQAGQYLSPMQSRWVYSPTPGAEYVSTIVAPNIYAEGGARKLVTAPAFRGQEVPGHISAVSSLLAISPSHSKADLLDGGIATAQGYVEHTSPVRNAAAGSIPNALKAQVAKERAKSAPAARRPQRSASMGAASRAISKATGVKG